MDHDTVQSAPRLLLIDDDRDDRELARRALEREFDTIHITEISDDENLEIELQRTDYDVVITDYMLRWSDGITVLHKILAQYPTLPVIMFTNTGNEEVCAEAMKAGLSDYIIKTSSHYAKLGPAVRAALENASLKHELRIKRSEIEQQNQRLRELLTSEQEAARQKDEFLALLAHELRNPLAPIRNAVYVLQTKHSDTDMRDDMQTIIERQVTHMARLIDDLLDTSYLTRSKMQLSKEDIDLIDVIEKTTMDYRLVFEKKEVALTLQLPEPRQPLFLRADPVRLAQIIGNLLHNASKFTDSGDQVVLQVTAKSGTAKVSVRDTGIGFDPKLLATIFEPFCQADTSMARSKGGLGLGLPLVKGLVELHGGDVSAYSQGKNCGAEFTISLPLVKPAPADQPQAAAEVTGCRILIIEDMLDTARSLQLLLQLNGHQVDVANSGPERADAIDEFVAQRSFIPEFVVCDIGLPGLNGYEVVAALKADERFDKTHFIAITGYGQQQDRERARQAGFDAHLTKPLDLNALNSLINSLSAEAD